MLASRLLVSEQRLHTLNVSLRDEQRISPCPYAPRGLSTKYRRTIMRHFDSGVCTKSCCVQQRHVQEAPCSIPNLTPIPSLSPLRRQPNGKKAASPRPPASPFEPAASPQTGVSVIGTDLTILGDRIVIISQNKLQVDGQVRGDVHGKEILVSKGGSVTGKVWAERIDVRGTVEGSIVAVALTLHDLAKVDGRHHASEAVDLGGSRVRRPRTAHQGCEPADAHTRRRSDIERCRSSFLEPDFSVVLR